MYINRLKNKKVFFGAGGNDLEVFNSAGVIRLLKMIKNLLLNSKKFCWASSWVLYGRTVHRINYIAIYRLKIIMLLLSMLNKQYSFNLLRYHDYSLAQVQWFLIKSYNFFKDIKMLFGSDSDADFIEYDDQSIVAANNIKTVKWEMVQFINS